MESNGMHLATCTCSDFHKEIIPYLCAFVATWGRYFPYVEQRKAFKYCPWCGAILTYREK